MAAMPRRERLEFAGAVYHVLDRGDRREAIFRDDRDRESFLTTLGEACARAGWRVHAYVLMGNHYHLLLETPEANLVKGMHWFQCTYTARFNRRHRLCGHLFQGRYKAVVVDPQERSYFAALSDYIHLNPVRARMLGEGRLADYRWSSYPAYVGILPQRPTWLTVETVLGELGLADRAGERRLYSERMKRRAEEDGVERAGVVEDLRRGWCLGGMDFRKRMLGLLDAAADQLGGRKAVDAGVARDHGEASASRMLSAALSALELTAPNMEQMRKNDPRKVAVGKWIKKATLVSNEWLAARLCMGHPSRVSRYCGGATEADPRITQILCKLEKMARCTT